MKTWWVILALLAAWLAVTLVINLPREYRLRKLARSRAGTDSFAAVCESLPDIPHEVLHDIYREVQVLVLEGFPLRADDDLRETLEIDQGDLEILMEKLGDKYSHANEDSEPGPINTFADLAKAAGTRKTE